LNKFSHLQLLLISRVEKFCGLEQLIFHLRKYLKDLPLREKLLIIVIIQYYQCIYLHPVECERDMVKYRERIKRDAIILNDCILNKPCKYLSFIILLQIFCQQYVRKVRRLT
jgi:hypothetical protein